MNDNKEKYKRQNNWINKNRKKITVTINCDLWHSLEDYLARHSLSINKYVTIAVAEKLAHDTSTEHFIDENSEKDNTSGGRPKLTYKREK